MFTTPLAQWEKTFNKPLKNQAEFLKKICKVNRHDHLIIDGAYFDKLSFDMLRQIFPLVKNAIETDAIDYNFQDIILDRLLGVSDIAHLYIEDEEVEMTFTVPAKKLNSIGMAMSMNFDDATAKIEFKGKPRKGTGSNPVSALKDAINSAGGEIED